MVYWLKCQISRTSMFKSPSPTMGTWQMTLGDSCALCCADKMEEERMTFMASLAPHWEKSRWKCVRKLLLLGAEWHTDGLKSSMGYFPRTQHSYTFDFHMPRFPNLWRAAGQHYSWLSQVPEDWKLSSDQMVRGSTSISMASSWTCKLPRFESHLASNEVLSLCLAALSSGGRQLSYLFNKWKWALNHF